jgi:hypothetical protein
MPRRTKGFSERKTVAIVGDGQMERIYFIDLRDTDRPKNLTIYPDFPRKIGNFMGVLDKAIDLSSDYDTVFALIDVDKIIQDKQQAKYEKLKKDAAGKGVIVLENNPCTEIWILLHFLNTGKLFTNCDEVSKQICKPNRIENYNKSEKFLSQAGLYRNFRHLIRDAAIPNARMLEKDRKSKDVLYPRAELFRFFEWYFSQYP